MVSQVILVGHSCGGASISYALELSPKKVSKAVFVSATMVPDGQRPFDVFSEEVSTSQYSPLIHPVIAKQCFVFINFQS